MVPKLAAHRGTRYENSRPNRVRAFHWAEEDSLAFRRPVWVVVLASVTALHYLLFGIVHNVVDTRPCTSYSPDPLFRFVPYDQRWTLITQPGYLLVSTAVIVGLLYRAIRYRADCAPLRLGIAVCVMSLLRMATLLMLPLCRATEALGAAPLTSFARIGPHSFSFPWRLFAVNDLVFSGHTGLFLILIWVTARWPKPLWLALCAFTVLMVYGLLATREHYTVDILLALPCSYFADAMARKSLAIAAHRGWARRVQRRTLAPPEEICA